MIRQALLVASLLLESVGLGSAFGQTFVRVNQLGYLPGDSKIAVVVSRTPLNSLEFGVVRNDGKTLFRGSLSADKGPYLAFPLHYLADFSTLKKEGDFRIDVEGGSSPAFHIGGGLYDSIPDSLLRFFAVQRCGANPALLHAPCHLADVTGVRSPRGRTDGLDLTGGWHDAGDYIKFTLTTAYASYLLLLTYDLFPDYFDDRSSSEGLEVLPEARIGLDWLMKMHPAPNRLLSQVQDLSDHTVGWRLPEADPLAGRRLGLEYPSRAHAGSAAAALALGAQVFREQRDPSYAARCLEHAVQLYDLARSGGLPDLDSTGDVHYLDRDPRDNVALAAAELYRATGKKIYLEAAKELADTLGAAGWVSWGDVQGLVCFRIARYYPAAKEYLKLALEEYQAASEKNPYAFPFESYPWGSSSLQSGVGIVALLYEACGGGRQFRPLAARLRDSILGANPFGVSYMSGIGSDWPRRFHHQVAHLKGVPLPGGVAGGPISRAEFESSGIDLETPDRFANEQSDKAVYHDDREDFLCNEPTISGNAQAFLLFTWYAADGGYRHR